MVGQKPIKNGAVFLQINMLAVIAPLCLALDNGLGLTPPMGWRSWNLYGANVNQKLMEAIMFGMVSRERTVDGVPTSLCDLGYCDVGLDDNWQKCGRYGKSHDTYHNAAGYPLVNTERFPKLQDMTALAHNLGLTAGFYFNNCICADHCTDESCYRGDVGLLFEMGFDGVKLDNCGAQKDLSLWSKLINETGKPILIENCHWGLTVPRDEWCPWNMFRTSGDVRAAYGSVLRNLQTTVQWAKQGLSRPGCWAYPDMLEVGCEHGPGGQGDPGLSEAETRAHFGSWAIVSSPLVLSHDVTNDRISDQIWSIIANPEVIQVNQAWAGHSGSPFVQSRESVEHTWNEPVHTFGSHLVERTSSPSWEYFYKPLKPRGLADAVLLMNHGDSPADLRLNFTAVPSATCTICHVRDLWIRKDLGVFQGGYVVKQLAAHDAAFLLITPAPVSGEMALDTRSWLAKRRQAAKQQKETH